MPLINAKMLNVPMVTSYTVLSSFTLPLDRARELGTIKMILEIDLTYDCEKWYRRLSTVPSVIDWALISSNSWFRAVPVPVSWAVSYRRRIIRIRLLLLLYCRPRVCSSRRVYFCIYLYTFYQLTAKSTSLVFVDKITICLVPLELWLRTKMLIQAQHYIWRNCPVLLSQF